MRRGRKHKSKLTHRYGKGRRHHRSHSRRRR